MRTRRFIEVVLLVLSGIASCLASGFGLLAGGWGGFWGGSNAGERILHLLFWLLPASSLIAFGTYFLSRNIGMLWSWAISIGSIMTLFVVNLSSCFAGQCTTTNPVKIAWGVLTQAQEWMLLIPSFGLYLAAVIHNRRTSSAMNVSP
jgi:hypothetical protein